MNPSNDDSVWSGHRAALQLDANSINLNAGTLSPTPRVVFDAVTHLREEQASAPSDFCWRQLPVRIESSRARLAAYLNCHPHDLFLLPNVTFAMNVIAASLQLPAGSEILTTDHEYGAMTMLWNRLAAERGLSVRMLKLPFRTEDPTEIVEAFKREMRDTTKMLFFSHCNASTGLVMPAKQLANLAKLFDAISVIDGAHAPGNVPVDLADIDADYYGANGHKWIMAPCGAGFLHVAPRQRDALQSIVTTWGYGFDRAQITADSGWGGTMLQRDIEFHGTADRCPQMVFGEALDFRASLGGDFSVQSRYRALVEHTRERLGRIRLTPATPANHSMSGCLIAFDFPCADPVRFRDAIWSKFHIECPVTLAGENSFLRVSCAWFNRFDDIDALTRAVSELR